jgi:hypothetical protein
MPFDTVRAEAILRRWVYLPPQPACDIPTLVRSLGPALSAGHNVMLADCENFLPYAREHGSVENARNPFAAASPRDFHGLADAATWQILRKIQVANACRFCRGWWVEDYLRECPAAQSDPRARRTVAGAIAACRTCAVPRPGLFSPSPSDNVMLAD